MMTSRSSGDGGSVSASSAGRTRCRVGRYELGRTLGEGTFAKVKFARNVETGENMAIKILDKDKLLRHKMIDQIKREISTMKLIRHPNVIRMFEVMASKTKIYIAMEFVTGGELFDKIATRGRMREDEARKYFQQLINAVDYFHSRGVCHRDLKPENLLLDANGVLKVSDFGLSALPQQVREDGLLHTTCGSPNYVAPEVINNKGYDGAKADLWSCGVILFVLMAGYLPFEESNIMALYKKIFKADFSCPPWFSPSSKNLIKRILDPNPSTMKLHGEKSGRKGHLSIATEIFEVAPSLYMVELRKAGGDTLEFHQFYQNLSTGLKDIVWKSSDEINEVNQGASTSMS